MHLAADRRWERVHPEPPELDRCVHVGEDHADDREVAHRHPPERLAGEAGLRVVVEPDRQVAAALGDGGPDRLRAVAADHVEHDVGAVSVGRLHHPVEDVVGGVVDRRPTHRARCRAPPSRGLRRPRSRGRRPPRRAGSPPCRPRSAPPTTRRCSPACSPARRLSARWPTWNGRVRAAASTSSSSGGASNTAVPGASACSAIPPRDWLQMPSTRRPIHCSAPARRRVDHAAHVHAERERRLGHDAGHAPAGAGDVAEVQRGGGHRDPHTAGLGFGHRDVEHLDRLRSDGRCVRPGLPSPCTPLARQAPWPWSGDGTKGTGQPGASSHTTSVSGR